MLARAEENRKAAGSPSNISFVHGNITALPLANNTADCIISNAVITLIPNDEKTLAFAEMARILRPGGRIAILVVLARKIFADALQRVVEEAFGYIANCGLKEDCERFLLENGFSGKRPHSAAPSLANSD